MSLSHIVSLTRHSLTFQILAVIAQPFIVLACYKGVGNHVRDVARADLADMLLWQWCYYVPILVSTIFSKLAVATLILQIQGRTYPMLRYMLYVVMTFTVVMGLLIPSIIFAQCSHVPDLWLTNAILNPKCKGVKVVLIGGTVQGSKSSSAARMKE